MSKENETTFDVRLEKYDEDKGDETRGVISFRIADKSGSPLTEVTGRVVSSDGTYDEEKSPSRFGSMKTFKDVPLPATFTIEAAGWKVAGEDPVEGPSVYEKEVTESDLGKAYKPGY